MSQNTFSMAGGVVRNPLVRLAKPVTATIGADEHIAIVGPNGSGKSLFVDTLIGKYPLREGALQYDFSPSATQTVYDNVKYIAFVIPMELPTPITTISNVGMPMTRMRLPMSAKCWARSRTSN